MRLIYLFLLTPLFAFHPADSLSDITKAMNTGDATNLGVYFDDNVEIALLSDEDIYDKTQAINKLEQFFSKHQPKAFSQVHEGTSKGSVAKSKYCIGNLQTSGKDFRVYMFISVEKDHYKIQELRIE